MKCCKRELEFLTRWDDAQDTDHCFNLYLCELCGSIMKHDTWANAGLLKIDINNNVEITKEHEE